MALGTAGREGAGWSRALAEGAAEPGGGRGLAVHWAVRSAGALASGAPWPAGPPELDRTQACTPRLHNGLAGRLGPGEEAQGSGSR